MAQQNRTTLKGYFNTGDFPTESNFSDLIDSNFNLSADDTDDITEGATNKFLSAASIENLASATLTADDEIPLRTLNDTLEKAIVSDIGSFTTVTDAVPANGALPNGKQILVVNSTVGRELYVGDASNNPVPACGYRQYVALLSQSGTDAPVATVIKNTLGGAPVWTRQNIGSYTCTLANSFTVNKTEVSISNAIVNDGGDLLIVGVVLSGVNDDIVDVVTSNSSIGSSDSILGSALVNLINIRVYV